MSYLWRPVSSPLFLAREFTGTLSFSTAENYEQTESILNEENAVNAESNPDTEAGSMVKTTVDSVSWENVLRIIAESNTETGRGDHQED